MFRDRGKILALISNAAKRLTRKLVEVSGFVSASEYAANPTNGVDDHRSRVSTRR
jgi:hypothetical protein